MKLEDLVAKYRAVRDAKKALEERHKAELAPYNDALRKAEASFLQALDGVGADSVATPSGTVYKTTKWSASVADFDAVLTFCKERDDYSILTRGVSHTVVRELLDEGVAVPGVNLSSFLTVGIRKGKSE